MDFTSHDIAVIEQALQNAIRSQSDKQKINAYQEVLTKLKNNAAVTLHAPATIAFQDGFRFDYDDSSDIR